MTVLLTSLRNPASRNVAFRLTLAAMIAMSVAAMIGVALPWWAAMAVWMIGQPPRGLLLERSLAQLVGTVLGASAGALLVLLGAGSPVVTLMALALWIGACCGLANMMRHQRAYGAVLCGLTSVVIVALTLGTPADPLAFAVARALDNLIGIASALGVAFVFGPPAIASTIAARARSVMAQTLDLIADALTEPAESTVAKEREFLLALAALEASAEDAAAGSMAARRELRDIKGLFASLLDLIVVARAIRSQEDFGLLNDHADLLDLKAAIGTAASGLGATQTLDLEAAVQASRRLEAADHNLASVLGEMRDLLERAAQGYERLWRERSGPAEHAYRPHPDTTGLKRAEVRGALVTLCAGLLWLAFDGGPLRFLLLGAGIFTVLFSVADEPAPAVRQIFFGGLAAAATATLWRLVVVPDVSNGWLSLALAVPFVFCASLLQAERATVFTGLAFNMLFVVLARPVDTSPTPASAMIANEAMLLAGIVLNYAFYRWLLPMTTDRRRGHLKASIEQEIHNLAVRAGSARAPYHLARLRYLVFGLAVRSGGQVQNLDHSLSALTLGHALLRLGEMSASDKFADESRDAAREILRLVQVPAHNSEQLRQQLDSLRDRIKQGEDCIPRLNWLLGVVAREVQGRDAQSDANGVRVH